MCAQTYLANGGMASLQDRRAGARIRTIYRSAKAISLDDSGLCLVLNLSDGGALIETALSLDPGDQLMLELTDGLAITGLVAWRDGLLTGVVFTPRIDCIKMLKQSSDDRWSGRGRPVRLAVKRRVEVISELGTNILELKDISQKGLKLSAESKLGAGMQVRIRLNPGLVVDGEVRWARDSNAGIKLQGQITVLGLGSAETFASGEFEEATAAVSGRRCPKEPEMAKASAEVTDPALAFERLLGLRSNGAVTYANC